MLMSYVVIKPRKGRKNASSSLKILAVMILNWILSTISISLVLASPWNTITHRPRLVMESHLALMTLTVSGILP